MAIDGIRLSNNQLTTQTAIVGKDASKLGMDDFMSLLAAQFSNQDMMNPVNDTEFIAQMAQFSALQGIQTIQEYQLSSYATSYVGKYVTIANQTQAGTLETIVGQVDGVSFYDGAPKVSVNGKTYDLFKVMEVTATANGGSLSEAASYIGKNVEIVYKNEVDEDKTIRGLVTGVTIKDGKPHVILDNKSEYPVSGIQKVVEDVDDFDRDDSDEDET